MDTPPKDQFGTNPLTEIVFLTAYRLGDEKAYGAAIQRDIAKRTGRNVSLSAIFTTLDRLEAKGYVSSEVKDGVNVDDQKTGSNPRRYFTVKGKGIDAYNAGRREILSVTEGLEGGKLVP